MLRAQMVEQMDRVSVACRESLIEAVCVLDNDDFDTARDKARALSALDDSARRLVGALDALAVLRRGDGV